MTDTMELKDTDRLIRSSDRTRIFMHSWHPVLNARGIVVIVPGFNAHGGRYQWVAEQFNTGGLAVYAVDLRGRGKSDGERFYIEAFADYVSDVAAVVEQARLQDPALPVFLLSHSAGGVIACFYALEHQHELSGLICESFAFELPAPDIALAALRGLSHIVPHVHVVRLEAKDFSRNPTVVEAMNNDPLIAGEAESTQTIAEMARAGARLRDLFKQITLPVLILHGTADKIAKPSGSQHFFDAAGSGDKSLQMYKGGFHDLINDTGKELVMSDISQWIDRRLPSH